MLTKYYSGLPAYHPNAIEQGFDAAKVDDGIQLDVTEVMDAGYNFHGVLAPPLLLSAA